MLLQFSVSNFMSLRDEVILSMAANTNDHEHEEVLFNSNNEKILPVAAIYGANAAGKSNVFKAIRAALVTVKGSNSRQINDPMPLIIPFSFDEEKPLEPTHFDFIFIINGHKYQYGFSADSERVFDEYLYEYKTARASKIFERTNTCEYSFTKANEKEFKSYVEKNTNNKLLIATATAWNCKKTKEPYDWLEKAIDVYDIENIERIGLHQIENGDDDLRNFLLDTLRRADFNIDNYSFAAKKLTLDDFKHISEFPDELFELLRKKKTQGEGRQYEIVTGHNFLTKDDGVKGYALPFNMESDGTQRMFFLSALFKAAIDAGKTVLIDEIDTSLHPVLVKFVVNMFNDRSLNKNGAQLIFSTHDVSLLSLDFFRRDQIYFAEKNRSTGATILYSLDEFSPRKTENIRKGYLQGRYGAIPFVDQGDLSW
jgi:AAA15 family ATPase/GTPase